MDKQPKADHELFVEEISEELQIGHATIPATQWLQAWLPKELLVPAVGSGLPGKMIVVEGPDGSGKSTLVEQLTLKIQQTRPVISLREPGGCDLSEDIRSMLKDPSRQIGDRAEALLFAAARAQLVDEVIRPALQQGTIVLLDRHVDSSVIYQGIGRGLGQDAIRQLSQFACQEITPDLVLVLEVSEQTAAKRMTERDGVDGKDRIESTVSMSQIRQGYQALTELDDGLHVTISAENSPEQVLDDAYQALAYLL